ELLAERLRDAAAPREAHQVVLRAMAQAGLREPPAAWTAALTQALTRDDAVVVREAAATARALVHPKQRPPQLTAALPTLGQGSTVPTDVRLTALAAISGGLSDVPPPLFAFVSGHLDREQPVTVRSLAADVLAHAKLNAGQLLALTE